jgi:pimeloyl-ACP methyl ester carboxylesterase
MQTMPQPLERYRAAETRLWRQIVGDLPSEQYLALPQLQTRVRVLTYGEGPTLLFVHGGPNAASVWTPLVKFLPDFRCVLLERPGCGLSDLPPQPPRTVHTYAQQLIADTLAGLDTEPEAIVASSFGSYCVLAFAVAHPSSVRRLLHMGCPALIPGGRVPLPFVLPMIPGLGGLVRKLEPPSLAASLRSFRGMGHGDAVMKRDDIAELMEWYTALTRDTATRTNDQTLFGRIRPSDALSYAALGTLNVPTSFFWGESDTFGGARVARALVQHMPSTVLEMVEASGHVPWVDAPERAATHVRAFVAAA